MGKVADDLWASLPLRERLPEYLAIFALGLTTAVVPALAIGLIFDLGFYAAVGYTLLALGLFCLLGGGASGGRYSALGLGAGAGRLKFVYDEDPNVLEDLRHARRPGRNPAAFWMVLAGFAYLGIGLVMANLG
jgi:hypothetical protein